MKLLIVNLVIRQGCHVKFVKLLWKRIDSLLLVV